SFVEVPTGRLADKEYAAAAARAHDRSDTTHVCVVDDEGGAVSLTHTLGSASGVVTRGLGFGYNDYMNCFDPRPGRPNSIRAGKTRMTMMTPTMVFDGDKLRICVGAPGGTKIVTGILQTIVNVLDHEMTPVEAVSAPRVDFQGDVVDPIKGLAIAGDVTKREAVESMVERTVKELGRIDVLVTCAGIIRDNLLYKMTDDDWDSVIDTHLKGTFLCARAAQKHMVEQKSGKMVFLSSTSALGNRGQTNYSAAKAGLQGMARTLAIELGPYNINVNAVAPGFVETRMTRATAERMGVDYETFKMGAASQIPLRRVGQPSDIASVIGFLCSDEAGFVSGQTVYVRGGP